MPKSQVTRFRPHPSAFPLSRAAELRACAKYVELLNTMSFNALVKHLTALTGSWDAETPAVIRRHRQCMKLVFTARERGAMIRNYLRGLGLGGRSPSTGSLIRGAEGDGDIDYPSSGYYTDDAGYIVSQSDLNDLATEYTGGGGVEVTYTDGGAIITVYDEEGRIIFVMEFEEYEYGYSL